MSKLKRILPLLAAAALLLAAAGRVLAAEPAVESHGAAAQGTAAHGGEGGHGGAHEEVDERLVPIPPSKDTIMTSLWVIVIFVVMLAILYPTAWKNVLAGLKAREERIRRDIADAEAARARAEATLKEYNAQLATAEARVRDMLAKATADGEAIAANIRTRAQQDAEDTKDRAMRDIDAARDQAVSQIHEQAAVLATSVAEKILRRNLNPDDQRDLVAQSLNQLQTLGAGNGRGRA
jgi:F-type H+-transporting ATPase subunit b